MFIYLCISGKVCYFSTHVREMRCTNSTTISHPSLKKIYRYMYIYIRSFNRNTDVAAASNKQIDWLCMSVCSLLDVVHWRACMCLFYSIYSILYSTLPLYTEHASILLPISISIIFSIVRVVFVCMLLTSQLHFYNMGTTRDFLIWELIL